jgi:hypothetical protein
MSATAAALFGALYADAANPEFLASETDVLTLDELQEALEVAHREGFADTADAIAFEIARLRGQPTGLSPGVLLATSGLWRVH